MSSLMQASMKFVIGLCLLATMCTSKAVNDADDDLLAERLQIRNAISNVESITRRLDRLSFDTEEDTISRVTQRQWDEMNNYRNYVFLLLSAMRREINAAKKKGIDAQFCYDNNSKGILGVTETASTDSEKCKETAENNIKRDLRFLDNIKLTGDSLIDQLDSLFLDCHDTDRIKMQACINRELAEISNAIQTYENDVNRADNSASISSNSAVLQSSKCLSNVFLLARLNSESSMVSNSKCIKDALENKKKIKNIIKSIAYDSI